MSVQGTAIAQRLSPSHIELAKSIVAKYEDTPAWLEYFEFRFSQQFPEAPEAFFISVRQEINQLGKAYDDSLSYLYVNKLSE